MKMNRMKKKTRIRPGIEPRSELIYFFIAGILLTDLKGLKIRNVLSAFRESEPPEIGSIEMIEMHTMKKSRQFQGSRKYVSFSKTKPMAMILVTHSTMKMIENTRSIFS